MKAGVSVVICCHNSGNRLPETLRHLAAQEVDDSIPWEVVIIDNASTDDTQAVAMQQWSRHSIELRVVSESNLGLSYARARGVNSCQFDYLCFIDDDNWVCSQWIRRVYDHFSNNSKVALLGGPSSPVFEVAPPDWFAAIGPYYAVGQQHARDGDITDVPGTLLWGAGLSVRKHAFIELLNDGFTFLCTGRSGGLIMAGEDSELCFALRALGWRIQYDSRLTLQHYIPASRLNWDYICKLMKGMGAASVIFTIYLAGLGQKPFDNSSLFISKWKKMWSYQFLKTIKNIFKVLLNEPLSCMKMSEGSDAVLKYQKLKGELSSLLNTRKIYKHSISKIKHAAWNRRGIKSGFSG